MKKLLIVMLAAIVLTGCAKKPETNKEIQVDLAAKLNKAGVKYMTIQMENGMATIDMRFCEVADLSVLAGLPISSINLSGNPITDLSPLKDAPITMLHLAETKVKDLSPLKGLKLTQLDLAKTEVTDLSALTGMPLEWFSVNKCKGVTSIAPLKGMPLTSLNISFTGVTDVSPLAGMELETIWFMPRTTTSGKSVLRSMASLKKIGSDTYLTMPAENFWAKYGG